MLVKLNDIHATFWHKIEHFSVYKISITIKLSFYLAAAAVTTAVTHNEKIISIVYHHWQRQCRAPMTCDLAHVNACICTFDIYIVWNVIDTSNGFSSSHTHTYMLLYAKSSFQFFSMAVKRCYAIDILSLNCCLFVDVYLPNFTMLFFSDELFTNERV